MSFTEGNDITPYSAEEGLEGTKTLYDLNQRQLGLWIQQQQKPSDYSYNVTSALKVETTLKAQELAQIATRLFNIQPCARTRFVLDKGVPKQTFDQFWSGTVNEYTVSRFEEGEQLLRKLERTPFELDNESPARINLISCGSGIYILNFLIHHIIGDAKSGYIAATLLGQELTQYFSQSTTDSPIISVESYVEGIMDFDSDNPLALKYWENYLKDIETGVDISHLPRQTTAVNSGSNPSDSPMNAPVLTKGNHEQYWDFNLSTETTSKIKKLAKQCRATPFCIYTALFGVLVNRCFRSNDFALGYVRDVRRKQDTRLAGFFIEQIPLALRFSDDITLESLIKKVKQDFSDHKKIGGIATGKIFQYLQNQTNKTPGKLNFFVSSTILESHNVAENLEQYDCRISTLPQSLGNMESALSLMMDLFGQTARFRLYFDTTIFSTFTIRNLEHTFRLLINEALTDSQQLTWSVPLLTAAQNAEFAQGVQYQSRDLGRWQNMAELFTAKCQQQPNALAVIDKERQYTYQEINQLTNLVAHKLAAKGVKPGDSIAICMDRSMGLMVSILGVLKMGATYVPLSPSLPPQRISVVLEDSNIHIAITQSSWVEAFPAQTETMLIEDALAEALHQVHLGNEQPELSEFPINTSNPLALVLYTSGSTGRPKGVEIPHLGVLNTLEDMLIEHPIVEGDIFLCRTSISFDCSLLELFGWFMGHGAVYMLAKTHELDIKYIINCINEHAITQSFFVPSLLTPLVDYLQNHPEIPALPSMKVMYAAGEKFPVSTYEKIAQLPMVHMALKNKFGPTEASIYCTGFNIRQWQRNSVEMPIGKAVSNMRTYVLDEHLQPLPPGFAGELCLSGIGLAAGYRNLPEKTAEVFIDNPFMQSSNRAADKRLYRTGDWVRVMEDGTLEILGRFDGQVKLRGQRIELGEIEDSMLRMEGVSYAAASVKQHGTGQLLVMYYSTTTGNPLPVNTLREHLSSTLPPYMVPQRFIHMEALPLLTSEKVDRKTLQALPLDDEANETPTSTPQEAVLPGKLAGLKQHQIEEQLQQIWRDILQFPEVGTRDNFFEIGGHSLLILQVTQQIYQRFGIELSVAEFFRFPNIQEMATFLVNSIQKSPQEDSLADTSQDNHTQQTTEIDDIAVIGLACRFPGADNADIFWHNLTKGIEGIREFSVAELSQAGVMPSEYQHSAYVKRKGVITGAQTFDSVLFGYSRREADIIDPQQRLLLEQAYHALEDAGYADISKVQNVGVYSGAGYSLYANEVEKAARTNSSISHYQILVGNSADYVSTRIAYKLNLKGPALTLQTACSTSLVAIERACNDLQHSECDMALAGGVSLVNGVEPSGYLYRDGMILSPDGHCRAFDARAQGTVPSQGVGMVVLKPLKKAIADGDYIRAVVKGAAINNDGNNKVGYTAPSIDGQRDVIVAAHRKAGVDPATISYIEAHGTGTAMGDPIEIAALNAAFASGSSPMKNREPSFSSAAKAALPPCAIGSVKSNLGHCDAAAGVAGFIKTVLCLEYKTLVPSLHFESPNPDIKMEQSGFAVNTQTRRWQHPELDGQIQPLRAGVSAFGIGGTNAHVVLEEAPDPILSDAMAKQLTDGEQTADGEHPTFALLPVSAASETALHNNIMQLQDFLTEQQGLNLQDVAFTLQTGRQQLANRACAVAMVHPGSMAASNENHQPLHFSTYNSAADKQPSHHSTPFAPQQISADKDYCLVFSGIESDDALRTYIQLYRHFGPLTRCVDDIANEIQAHWRVDLSVVLRGLKRGTDVIEVTPQPHIRELLELTLELGFAHCLCDSGFQAEAVLGSAKGQVAAACFSQSISLNAGVALLLDLPLTTTPEQVQANAKLRELIDLDLIVKAKNLYSETLLESSFLPLYLVSKEEWLDNIDAVHRQMSRIDLSKPLNISETDIIFADPAVVNLRNIALFEGVQREHTPHPKIQHFANQASEALHQLYTLFAELWCRGASIQWHDFYQEKQPQRLPLPKYAFDSQTHWLPAQANGNHSADDDMWQSLVGETLTTMFANEYLIENVDFVNRKFQLHEAALIYMGRIIKQLSPTNSSTEFNFNDLDLAEIPIQNHDLINDWVDALTQYASDVMSDRVQDAINSDDALKDFENLLRRDWAGEREFIVRVINCGHALHDCLRGERNILTVLTAEEEDSSSLNSLGTDDLAKASPQIEYCNSAMRSVLQTIVQKLPDDGSLRAVEIGGGSGYGTSVVLPELQQADCYYHFTDISPLMLYEAEKKFASYSFVDFAKLNIEQSPLTQGYQLHSYDLVIAVNSLHTARDIDETLAHVQQLLAPGGVLLLWEITQDQLDFGITEGFLMQPVYDNLRNRASPFISTEKWREKLHNHGFESVELLTPAPNSSHSVMVAQAGIPKVKPAFSYRSKTDLRQKHIALQKSETAGNRAEPAQTDKTQTTGMVSPVKKAANKSAPEHVLEIWQNHLNVEGASPEDDFFVAGGESLMALGLIDDLNKAFSLDMPANVLYETPTLGSLTEYVVEQLSQKPKSENSWSLTAEESPSATEQEQAAENTEQTPEPEIITASQFNCLVRLQSGTNPDLAPIFLIHAAGGGLFIFSHLINALGKQYTVYGFESPPELTQNSISELADTYLDALLTQFPEQESFILGGHSFGPVVALEMANKLQTMEKQVETLLLIDPPGPGKMPFKVKNYADILYHLNDDLVDIDYEHMQRLTLEEQIDYLKNQAGPALWQQYAPIITPAFVRTFKKQLDMLHDYNFAPFNGNAIYFYPSITMPLMPEAMYTAWRGLVKAQLQIVEVEGNHISMNEKAGAEVMAKAIKQHRNRAI